MSQPSRPRANGPAQRRKRDLRPDIIMPLEQRCLLAPVLPLYPLQAVFTAATTPTNGDLGTVVVSSNTTATTLTSAAPITSVSETTPLTSFGGDNVRIKAGPGGVFGNGLYAISRGAGSNTGAVNRPGVIYRVDPATGKASVFFDLNTVMSQIDPNALNTDGKNAAANSLGGATGGAVDTTGFANWYDIAFDPEGYIDGKPSMLVSTVDRSDPSKNAIYRIGPDGSFLGAYVTLTDGQAATKFNINPTGMVVPGPEMQQFLRGVIAGSGISSTGGTMAALFFNANQYSPGQVISNGSNLPKGASETGLTLGPIVGITQANVDYTSPLYSAFTDFGTPTGGGIPAKPGFSGVQGSNGGLLIGTQLTSTTTGATTATIDQTALVTTPFRRFEDIAFDQYGYFSQSMGLTASATGTGTTGGSTSGTSLVTVTGQPTYAGSLFVSDLASGLSVNVVSVAEGDIPAGVTVPIAVQGSGVLGIQKLDPSLPYNATTNPLVPIVSNGNTTGGSNAAGGRIVRITPEGVMTVFAQGFNTSAAQDSTSFMDSSLSITFSADGTTMYASDGDGIWQFKTTASLAGSTSGTLIGLNDLRTLGVPYNGQGSAVAVVDTGVDGLSAPFRGRVSTGKNIYTGGPGNADLSSFTNSTSGTGGTTGGTGGGTTGGTGGTTNGTGNVLVNTFDGHGTPVAGVVAQFVPQATIEPVAIFSPYFGSSTLTVGGGTGGTGGTGGGTTGGTGGGTTSGNLSASSNALTSTNAVYSGMDYVAKHPFVNDPVRPGVVNRVVASVFAFGTTQTFATEAQAYKNYPQIVIALKNQLHKYRRLGIAPIAAAGQFGAPLGASSGGSTGGTGGTGGGTTGGTGGGTTGGTTGITTQFNNSGANPSIGDNDGMSLPAVLNEAISVTGTYPFPYSTDASTTPNNPPIGAIPNPLGPVLIFGNALTIGGTASSTTGTGNGGGSGGGGAGAGAGGGGTTGSATSANVAPNVQTFAASDFNMWNDRIPGAVNRSITTDFAAPAIDVPTFRRRFSSLQANGTTTTTGTGTNINDPANHLTFTQVGTSMSSAIVTGAYTMVSSALNYWTNLNKANGVTSDAYLTTPVGVRSLNFGRRGIKDLSAYNTPDGINGILAYTAVPAFDVNDGNSVSTPNLVSSTDNQNGFSGGDSAPAYARVSIGNAIASIEGTIAIRYLLDHKIFPIMDENNDGVISAQEVQDFTDTAATKGLAEAGAMARLLGGTSTTSLPQAGINNQVFNENPDQPAALQRRFNYFDFVANGQLKGGISLDSFRMLANTLLPKPDSYNIIDRQRASANGFLVDPTAQRNTTALQHKLPSFAWVPKSAVAKYRGVSPAKFKVNRNETPGTYFPVYTLFDSTQAAPQQTGVTVTRTVRVNGETISLASVRPVAAPAVQTAAPTTTTTTPPATTTTPPATTPATTGTTTPPAATPAATGTTTPSATTPAADTTAGTTTSDTSPVVSALLNLVNQSQQQSAKTATSLPAATPSATTDTSTTTTTPPATTTTPPAPTEPTATPAVATAATTTADTTASDLAAQQLAASQAQAQAQKQKALALANANKNQGFFDKLWSDIKKPFS
ncbi:hypothetical protein [Paludisphaera borealis]|uniref:Peptidase S8 n=1 Tax=Paludisphaera borealis TaxID=1387353 RepID=A0A1U7CKC2_9BACT|nr:hypothetical protein [Paludisphaera borealis]APW59356.1 Peptidase S8 [Paludisphaera borealis]